jgi:hypothetical protein
MKEVGREHVDENLRVGLKRDESCCVSLFYKGSEMGAEEGG